MDSDEDDLVSIATTIVLYKALKEKTRKLCVHGFLSKRHSAQDILNELTVEDRFGFKNFL